MTLLSVASRTSCRSAKYSMSRMGKQDEPQASLTTTTWSVSDAVAAGISKPDRLSERRVEFLFVAVALPFLR